MKPSKYLAAFEKNSSNPLFSDALWVERVEIEEKKTSSGLIISASNVKQVNTLVGDQPLFVHVLAAGRGYYDDSGSIPLSVKPGSIILVGQQSVKWFSLLDIDNYDPYSIGLSRESEVQMHFESLSEYHTYFGNISRGLVKPITSPDML